MTQTDFCLLETILYEPDKGFFLLDLHLQRLQAAIDDFKKCIPGTFLNKLSNFEYTRALNELIDNGNQYYRIRLLMDNSSQITVTSSVLDRSAIFHNTLSQAAASSAPICSVVLDKQAFDCEPGSSNSLFIQHKTTNRDMYNAARERAQCTWDMGDVGKPFDVVLWNRDKQITETSIANIAVRTLDQQGNTVWKTPRLACGLLPGVFRTSLLHNQQNDRLIEDIITVDELIEAHKAGNPIVCFNSVRKAYKVNLLLTIGG